MTEHQQDNDWSDTGGNGDTLQFLSELVGPKGMAFDNDDILDDSDDEDLKGDPISQMDMQVWFDCSLFFYWC